MNKLGKIIRQIDEKLYEKRYGESDCNSRKKCGGDCWLNVAGGWQAFELIAPKCKGTIDEKELLDKTFNIQGCSQNALKLRKEICKKYKLRGWRKKYIMENGIGC